MERVVLSLGVGFEDAVFRFHELFALPAHAFCGLVIVIAPASRPRDFEGIHEVDEGEQILTSVVGFAVDDVACQHDQIGRAVFEQLTDVAADFFLEAEHAVAVIGVGELPYARRVASLGGRADLRIGQLQDPDIVPGGDVQHEINAVDAALVYAGSVGCPVGR